MSSIVYRHIYLSGIAMLCIVFLGLSCNDDDPVITYEPFIDSEGNVYPIGRMCDGKIWMLKNLSISVFRNGDPIPYVNQAGWKDSPNDSPAHCTVLDSVQLEIEYGHLYNWYAVSDHRGLAPPGWHVPTLEEWQLLIDCNGGNAVAGDRLKEAGTAHWNSGNGNNKSGFNALPGSRRVYVPDERLGEIAVFWTAEPNEECFNINTPYYATHDLGQDAYTNCGGNDFGFSVRCVKDE
jgi:uncharacterized protein (TIGR02145 family)